MRILLTGHDGYLGAVMRPLLVAAGHQVQNLDALLFADCRFGELAGEPAATPHDVRDIEASDFEGLDAVIHLAALSNDPLGNLNPALTDTINHLASVRLARMAREAGVERFLFASSCSLYGVAGEDLLDENAPFSPVTAYGRSKVAAEQGLRALANDRFSPVYLRNATAYGLSPRLRLDLVVNDLVARAVATGEILVLSDGTPWRPLVHAEDIALAFLAALAAPREAIHNRAFNVGRTEENYRVSQLAEMVAVAVPGARVRYAAGGGPDPRCYRVDCTRIATELPGFQPRWAVERGIRQLRDGFAGAGLTPEDITGPRYFRIRRLQELMAAGRLDAELRWTPVPIAIPW